MSVFSSIESINQWLVSENTELPVIAGPCSAESKEQLLETAKHLFEIHQITAFRCGLWKPRTQPGGFEGVGEKGLPWLKEIQEKFGLKVCVEIATPLHLEKCLKAGINFFWIGARTTGNPFSIAELCEAVKGTNIPLLIKNPLSPDLKLWTGTIERFYNAGCRRLTAVHRGFGINQNHYYRNEPCWNIPIEMHRLYPELPIFCDPSHMGGKKSFLEEISQKALNLNFSGLMIEAHAHPENAHTDKEQQITPKELLTLLNKLIIRENHPDSSPNECLTSLRKNIDSIDNELIHFLSKRMEIIQKIAEIKRQHNLPVLQIHRWDEILKNTSALAVELGLDKEFIQHLMGLIHNESIRIQNIIINKKNNEL